MRARAVSGTAKPIETDVLERVRAGARDVLSTDRAQLRISLGPVYSLQPTNSAAAPLGVQVDMEHQVTFLLGRYGVAYEVFSRDRSELLHEVDIVVKAVIEGRYEERLERRPDDPTRPIRAVGTLHTGNTPIVFTYNVWSVKRARGPSWEHLAYEPY